MSTSNYDVKSDIYSYGAAFTEIWTGTPPYSTVNCQYYGIEKKTAHINCNSLLFVCLFVTEFVQKVVNNELVKKIIIIASNTPFSLFFF